MNEVVKTYERAVEALNRRQWHEVQALCVTLMRQAPEHAGVHFIAGVSALELRRFPDALNHLKHATVLNPKRADYLAQLARGLSIARLLNDAVEAADQALALDPVDPLTLDTIGVIFTQANEHGKAAKTFRKAVELLPDRAGYRFNLATSLLYHGDTDAAEREYEACIALDPGQWKAYLALSQLRKQTTEHNHLERLRELLEVDANPPEAVLCLNLALAKELEDLARYPEAFTHYSLGKSSQRDLRGYAFERDRKMFADFASVPGPRAGEMGSDSHEPIFVFGMPRSGTTLVDRILSSHSSVHSAGELQEFGLALKRLSGSTTPELLDEDTIKRADAIDMRALGDAYLASTRPGTGQTPHFIDKLPHNFLYAGFIARAFPNAKMICLRRDPMDVCLSNFRQLFALRSPFYDYSFDIMDTGRYFIEYARLMAHWQRLMPGRILEVDYEGIVEDQESMTRQLLEFCGLPWEDACMSFEKNKAPVATASLLQVREPIYRSSMQRWRRYENELAGLRAMLTDAGIQV